MGVPPRRRRDDPSPTWWSGIIQIGPRGATSDPAGRRHQGGTGKAERAARRALDGRVRSVAEDGGGGSARGGAGGDEGGVCPPASSLRQGTWLPGSHGDVLASVRVGSGCRRWAPPAGQPPYRAWQTHASTPLAGGDGTCGGTGRRARRRVQTTAPQR